MPKLIKIIGLILAVIVGACYLKTMIAGNDPTTDTIVVWSQSIFLIGAVVLLLGYTVVRGVKAISEWFRKS